MGLANKDRVKELSTTTGTGTYTLAGAVAGFQAFSAVGDGNTCDYAATDGTGWETGLGTYTAAGTTLARTTIYESSNGGAAVNWGAGTKTLFVTGPASKLGALNRLTAATAANSINHGDNLQTWNWQKTTNSSGGIRITENVASTGGTSTAGIPNQYLLLLDTIATSTASALVVKSQGNYVFSISPSSAQILLKGGSGTAVLSFANDDDTGIGQSGANKIDFYAGGTNVGYISSGGYLSLVSGTTSTGAISWSNGEGFYLAGTDQIAIGLADGLSRGQQYLFHGGSNIFRMTKSAGDAVSHIVEARKSRGELGGPAVITTGDDLLLIRGVGYVGATATWQNGGYIRFDSSGTVTDAANGFAKDIIFGTNTATNASSDSIGVMADGTLKLFKNDSTGAGTALLGTNCPAVTVSAPYTWMKFTSNDGSTVYVPAWK